MKVVVVAFVLSVLGSTVSGQYAATIFPYYQKNGQTFNTQEELTTAKPHVYTETSMSPQTSVSVHHTIVRNKPAYPYPYTDSKLQSEGSEDTSYYYTYEDTSDENPKTYFTTPVSTTPSTTKSVRSFWNSQKAQLEARRKESAQKFISKPTTRTEIRPKVEFKVREKPKFGQANKNKDPATETDIKKDNKTQADQSTTPRSVKFNKKEYNSPKEKDAEEDEVVKGSSKSSSPALENQIVGRVGEIPLPNRHTPIRTQGKFGNSVNYQQAPLRNNLLVNNLNQPPPVLTGNNPDPFMVDLSKQQQALTPNQQAIVNNQKLQDSIQALLNSNQEALLKMNQQPLLQQTLLRSNQQQQLSSNLQPLVNNVQQPAIINRPPLSAFISATPAESNAVRSEQYVTSNSPASNLLQRLGSLGLNLGGDLGDVQGRDVGYGPSGLSFNLGPVSDPLSILLKLLSLLPRPLLDLNGRLFFGIELGKNAGIVSGVGAKPIGKPIG